MAESNCIAHCAACEKEFVRATGIGRPSIYCSVECRQNKKPGLPIYRNCLHCSEEILAPRKGKMYCSSRCAYRHRDGTKQTREQYREKCRAESKHRFLCEFCGKESCRPLSRSNSAKGYSNRYCSMECRVASAAKISKEVAFLRRLSAQRVANYRDKLPGIRALVRMISRVALRKANASIPCLCCGLPVGYSATRPKRYCSKECASKMPHAIAAKKISKAKRRARIRGAGDCDSINPVLVFIAAGWKCQICGRATPQRLRGTYHKRAPELDHIIPLSKGGTHTWGNVQCLCRECNGWKSDKMVIGQAEMSPPTWEGRIKSLEP